MSTLAAARADNFYFSKNYDPKKIKPKKSDTAEQKPFKVVQGQRVGGSKVRYETPFHVRCNGCQNMIGKGVRFNAIKTWVDNFHSTKIYEFRMKCPQCPQKILVRTDPQNCDYVYVSGAKRIFQTKDCTDETRIRDESIHQKIAEDPFYKLENELRDKEQYGNAGKAIQKIKSLNQRGLQDFELNRALRKKARVLREEQAQYHQQKLERNMARQIPLLAQQQSDKRIASKILFKNKPIKKQQGKKVTERDRLKQKMKLFGSSVKKQLKSEIKAMNKPTTSVYLKK